MHRKSFGTSTKLHRFKAIVTKVAPMAAAASAAFLLWQASSDKPAADKRVPWVPPAPAVAPALRSPAVAPADGALPVNRQADIASTSAVLVGKNDTMDVIFRRMALAKADLAAIRNLPGIRQSLDFLRPGDTIRITHTRDGEIKELSQKISETEIISNPVETHVRTATATIDSSLFQAAEAADMSDVVAMKLANVFAWDIDFVLDIRTGDHFTVEYEQIYQGGHYLRDGEILAAEFVNSGRAYRAVRFTPQGGSSGYFTPDGKPVRKAFLRAPVDFTRVSSVFDPHRMHPLLNRIRGHMGIDYAAPTGTPVHAAGDGRVSFKGTRGGYGNAVMLLHGNSVSTLYGHMSRFARHLRLGSHVNQGEVIGYVGMSGLATGPHLHYEYLMKGVHMNPQTVRLAGADPLPADSLSKFRSAAAPLLSALTASPSTQALAAPVPSFATPETSVAAAVTPRALNNSRSQTAVN